MNISIKPKADLRTDIQMLRGFAVLIVVFYQAKLSLFSAGYLGVDIFFVISGFLITRLIKQQLEAQSFNFLNFYIRRAIRLLPAAYVTFLVTTLLVPFVLTSAELEGFRAQLIGAISFTSNIVFWRQSGYFEGASELKPLLHVWSLSIEEQFYFVLPAFLVVTPRRFWLSATIAVCVSSVALCLVGMQLKPSATFYLLPTRAWELAVGSVGALVVLGPRLTALVRFMFWPGLMAVLLVPFLYKGDLHPGPAALLICLATLVVILRKYPLMNQGGVVRALRRSGDISYSLYLVHWPLFAFFNNIWLGAADDATATTIRLFLIALSLVLAYLLNRYVEVPARRLKPIVNVHILLAAAAASSMTLIVLVVGISHFVKGDRDYSQIAHVSHGLNDACEFTGDFAPIAQCRNSETPAMLVWGDSYAMHLIYGIVGEKPIAPSVVQATRSSCGPFLGIAPINGKELSARWARNCIAFNESVVAYLKNTASISTVVLSSPFTPYVQRGQHLLKKSDDGASVQDVDAGSVEALAALKRTIDAIRALGKRVVVIAPPPSNGVDNSRCSERGQRKLPSLGRVDCDINVEQYRKSTGDVLAFLAELQQQAPVNVISFDPYLCDSLRCKTLIGSTFIYRDAGHLSQEGSIFLARRMGLAERINQTAN